MLIVDDDPIFREFASILFSSAGALHVAACPDVVTALAALQDARPDLMVLDLNMPDRDGVELIDALQQLEVPPPILIVSGSDTTVRQSAAVLANAYGLRIVGVVEKPLTKVKLNALRLPFARQSQGARA